MAAAADGWTNKVVVSMTTEKAPRAHDTICTAPSSVTDIDLHGGFQVTLRRSRYKRSSRGHGSAAFDGAHGQKSAEADEGAFGQGTQTPIVTTKQSRTCY